MSFAWVLLLALPAVGLDGGHQPPSAAGASEAGDRRRAVLEEMWQRRLLPPDQKMWSPADQELLGRMRRAENDALALLRRKFGGLRPWVAKSRGGTGVAFLTKFGYETYLRVLTQEAIEYFESKGVDAKKVFKLRSWDGRPLFDGRGSITEDGADVYRRAGRNQEVFWRLPGGEVFGTRRPPQNP